MKSPGGLYASLARYALRNGKLVMILSVLLTVVASAIGLPPKVDSNLLNLLPESDPAVRALQRINDEEGGVNVLTLTYKGDDPDKLDAFLDQVVERTSKLEDVQFAIHEVDPQLALHIGLLQLDPGELRELSGRLEGALALGSAASNPFIASRLMDMGPLTEKIEKASGKSLLSANNGRARVIIRPSKPPSDPIFARKLMDRVNGVLAELDKPDDGIELLWTGGAFRHTVEDVEGIKRDLVWTNVFSVVALVGILVAGFRSVRTLGILLPPLFVANAITLAFASIAFGSLNTYTSLGTAILFGLGIDYSVHLVGRYRENRLEGLGVEDAMAESWALTGPPCTTAAITSAAGFVALTVAEFKGFAQLGMLLAVGLVLCLIANLVMLPPLIGWLERDPKRVLGAAEVRGEGPAPSYGWAPGAVVITTLITIAMGAYVIPRVGFEYDMSELRRNGMAFSELTEDERQMVKDSYAPVVVSYHESEGGRVDLLAEQKRVEDLMAEGKAPHINAVVSIAKALPADQEERNVAIQALVTQVENPNLRYLPPILAKRLLPLRGLHVETITRESLPLPIQHLIGATRADVQRLLIFPKGNMWDVREAQALKEEITTALPGREIAGEHIGVATMFIYALRDTPRMVALVIALVLFFTWLDLRRVTWTAGALGALGAGIIWATTVLHLVDTKLSMVNLTGIPILLGMGVDVVVHLSHRMRDEGPGGIGHALRTTGVAAGISTATNAASFGSLVMAGNRGVRGLGTLVGVGLVVLTIVSVALLAALWAWGWRFRPDARRVTHSGGH